MTRTDKIRVSVSAETVAGTTNSSPVMLTVEHNDVTPSPSTPKAPSDVIRTDSRVKSHVALNRAAGLSFSADLAYPTASQGLRALMVSALNSTVRSTITTSLSGAGNGIFDDSGDPKIIRSAGSFISDGWVAGDIGAIASASVASDNRAFRVLSVEATTMSVELPDLATWDTDDTSVTVSRNASIIDNAASSEQSYTVEVAYLDEGNMDVYTGQVVDSMSVGFAMGQKSTVSFGFVGREVAFSAMSSNPTGISGATYPALTQTSVFSPAAAISVVIGGVSYPVRSATITTSRGCRPRHSTVGGATPDAIVPGRFTVSVQMSVHRSVYTLMQAAKASHEQTLWVSMANPSGSLHFSAGVLSIDSATSQGGGAGSDVMVNLTGALTHSTTFDAGLLMTF